MTTLATLLALAIIATITGWTLHVLKTRHVHLWLMPRLRGRWAGRRERAPRARPAHVLFCLADHYEPAHANPGVERERFRVERWVRDYPQMVARFRDADGRPPRHSFFFPSEQYRSEHLDRLGALVEGGYGEVEVHLHHDGDTSENLRRTLAAFKEQLCAHGHLGRGAGGEARYGFIHGNWALDNSSHDGRWCGVNDELCVLRDTGCYADFTYPSAPASTQTRRINSIYYATDVPDKPRSHDDGVEVCAGGRPCGDLMIIQGPLAILWPGGRFGMLPRLENGNLAGATPMNARRVRAWVETRVIVAGRPDWLFVKVHTHGCAERNWSLLFGDGFQRMHRELTERYNDGARHKLHYVTAREMYNLAKAAERGLEGDPNDYRDLEIAPPPRAAWGMENRP